MEEKKQDYSKMNIFKKKAAASNLIGKIYKSKEITFNDKVIYSVATEGDIIPKIAEVEEQLGLTTICTGFEEIESLIGDKNVRYVRLKAKMVCVNTDNPDEKIEFDGYGEAIDTADKGCGKAQTYAQKYALMKFYKIVGGDDTDNHTPTIDNTKLEYFTLNQVKAEVKKQKAKCDANAIYNFYSQNSWKDKSGNAITDLSLVVKAWNKAYLKEHSKEQQTKQEQTPEQPTQGNVDDSFEAVFVK